MNSSTISLLLPAALVCCTTANVLPSSLKPEPHQRDPYNWQARHESIVERHKTVKPEYVVIGDSITHRWGGDPVDTDRKMGRPGAAYWDDLFQSHTATNMGFGFDYVDNAYYRVQHGELDGTSPRVIVLLIGTNNLGHRKDTAEQCAANVKAFVQLLRTKCPSSKILILGILPRKEEQLAPVISKTNALVSKLQNRKNIFFRDISPAFTAPGSNLASPALFSDTVHPNAAGYAKLTEQLKPILKQIDPQY